jgi:cytochrome P450
MSSQCPQFDHHEPISDDDRCRIYADLRACPTARSDASGGFWVLSRFDDVAAAAEDWRTYSSAGGVLLPVPMGRRGRQVALEQDPPEHTPYRRLYAELLNRSRVRAVEDDIRSVAADRLAGLAAGDPLVVYRLVRIVVSVSEQTEVRLQLGAAEFRPYHSCTTGTGKSRSMTACGELPELARLGR